MKPGLAPARYATPFGLWMQLASSTNEMLWASARVIGYRTNGMVQQGINPTARGRRELALMGQEKLAAAAESTAAMTASMLEMNLEFGFLMMKQSMAAASSMLSLSASRTAGNAFQRQVKLIGNATSQSAANLSRLSGSTARLAQLGLKPIHSRATSNAKRLSCR